jgi:hypothetical protein
MVREKREEREDRPPLLSLHLLTSSGIGTGKDASLIKRLSYVASGSMTVRRGGDGVGLADAEDAAARLAASPAASQSARRAAQTVGPERERERERE